MHTHVRQHFITSIFHPANTSKTINFDRINPLQVRRDLKMFATHKIGQLLSDRKQLPHNTANFLSPYILKWLRSESAAHAVFLQKGNDRGGVAREQMNGR